MAKWIENQHSARACAPSLPPLYRALPRIERPQCGPTAATEDVGAGWSSPVARQAHNLKVVGSNPAPAPNFSLPLIGGVREEGSDELDGAPAFVFAKRADCKFPVSDH